MGYSDILAKKIWERDLKILCSPTLTLEEEFSRIKLINQLEVLSLNCEQFKKNSVNSGTAFKKSTYYLSLQKQIKRLKSQIKAYGVEEIPYVDHDEVRKEADNELTEEIEMRKNVENSLKIPKEVQINGAVPKSLEVAKKLKNPIKEKNMLLNEKLEILNKQLNAMRESLQESGIKQKDSKAFLALKQKVFRMKLKIKQTEVGQKSLLIEMGPTKSLEIDKKKENLPGINLPLVLNIPKVDVPEKNKTKKILKFDNLNFIMQWELAPVLVHEKCNPYIPAQVEDLHAFILGNYSLSKTKTFKIPIQTLAVQFLFYLIERENSNVRINNLGGLSEITLETLAKNCLYDLNAWKSLDYIVSKNFGFNKDIKNISADASLGDTYFSPISNPTNSLSVDGMGNFLELFKARIEWVSKTDCSKLATQSLVLCNKANTTDQVTVIINLNLKPFSWLSQHRFLVNWHLPPEAH